MYYGMLQKLSIHFFTMISKNALAFFEITQNSKIRWKFLQVWLRNPFSWGLNRSVVYASMLMLLKLALGSDSMLDFANFEGPRIDVYAICALLVGRWLRCFSLLVISVPESLEKILGIYFNHKEFQKEQKYEWKDTKINQKA